MKSLNIIIWSLVIATLPFFLYVYDRKQVDGKITFNPSNYECTEYDVRDGQCVTIKRKDVK